MVPRSAAALVHMPPHRWAVQLYARAPRAGGRRPPLRSTARRLAQPAHRPHVVRRRRQLRQVHHGLPGLAVLAASVDAPCERYEYAVDGLTSQLRRLELPPLDYCHLRAQPLLRGGAGECLQLSRALAAIGAELCAWARLDDPLPPNDGAADALPRDARPSPSPPPQDAANLVS